MCITYFESIGRIQINNQKIVEDHYTNGELLKSICAGIYQIGKLPGTVTMEDLSAVDEFHIGGRKVTKAFLDPMNISVEDHVLDVGCGIGGSSRFAAKHYGCNVTGIDLTKEYVDTGNVLCSWLGSNKQVKLVQGDAVEINAPDATFDKAFMLHVGMNIANKVALAQEIKRVLKPGGIFGIYDIMQTSSEPIVFPVPWASTVEASILASPDDYKNILAAVGFELTSERNQRKFALQFFEHQKAISALTKGSSPLGLHLLMGETASTKVKNMVENIAMDRVAPIEMFFRKTY
jgi:SAM-dependent methyltransferase